MTFMDNLVKEQNNEKTLTDNMAVAYKTSGDELLDFNFRITDLRSCSEEEIVDTFRRLFFADKTLAIKYLFYVGDIREGLGERKIFKSCITWLAKAECGYARKVLELISEYSRWDILVSLITVKTVKDDVVNIIRDQLVADENNMQEGKSVSLLAKWLPSENTSCKDTRNLARVVMKNLNMSPKKYRKTLSKLRSYIDVVEVKMSNKDWDKINYESVPSKANLIYQEAFLRNDPERRTEYLESLKAGKAKINAGVLQPHEIVFKYCGGFYGWGARGFKYNETLEQLWNNLPDITINNTLVVRDGSGSMWCQVSGKTRAIDVATALAIYCSEHTSGQFKNKFITFSSSPKVVDLSSYHSLKDKLDRTFSETEMSNTDIYKTMRLILDTAINNDMVQEDLPDTVLIVSDMQFDGRRFSYNESLFDSIKREYEEYGYKLPKICFWNLDPYDSKTIPMQNNDLGLILCSGFSVNNLKMFMSGEIDPLKILLDIINSERYKKVEDALIA